MIFLANAAATQARVRRRYKFILSLCLTLLAFVIAPKLAFADEHQTEIKIPAHGTVELPVSGYCLEYGKPFPGEVLVPVGLVSDEVRMAISYNVEHGILDSDMYAAQMAVWSLTDGVSPMQIAHSYAQAEQAETVANYARHSPAPAAGSASLIEAIKADTVSVSLSNFQSVSSPEYFGHGTLVISNRTDREQIVHMPYGVRFRDVATPSNQDMALFASGHPRVTVAAGPPGPQGGNGLNCWDKNGNGVEDLEEDTNRDGQYNALDCIGPQGPPGPQGPQGPQGPAGADGRNGADGADGLNCWDTNANGVGDPEEDTNGDGDYTAADCKGEQGDVGPSGPQGERGPQGLPAPIPPSPPSQPGPPGPEGPAGSNGLNCWDTNSNGVGDSAEDKNGDGNFTAEDCQGPPGPPRPAGPAPQPGKEGAPGPAGPAGEDGAQGLAGPQGPQGPTGPQGSAGPAGEDGAQGPAGPRGLTGPAGADGAQGPVGPAGADGAQGPVGPAGADGAQGLAGPAGANGAPGSIGPQGPAGSQGPAGPTGAQGPAGVSCWDRNLNGTADATEDMNGDGVHNAIDCLGPTGPQGPAGVSGGVAGSSMVNINWINATTERNVNSPKELAVQCPAGQTALFGYVDVAQPESGEWIVSNPRNTRLNDTTWYSTAEVWGSGLVSTATCGNCENAQWDMTVWVACVSIATGE